MAGADPTGTGRPGVGECLVTGRSLAEYRAMFALTGADLAGRILDCPGGAASFVAERCAAGGDAVAADPAYALPAAELAARAAADADRTSAYLREHATGYRWDFYGDPAAHHRVRVAAAAAFAAHRAAEPGRYVAAALPTLPFADGAFDLALSSHLLFTYADRLDAAFHLAAALELARVAAEARVYPLLPYTGGELASRPDAGGELASRPDNTGGELASRPDAGGELASRPDAGGELASRPDAGGELASRPDAGGELASRPDNTGGEYGGLADLRAALAARGVRSELRPVGFEFQRGANHMLVLARI